MENTMRSMLALALLLWLPTLQAGTLLNSEVTDHRDNSVTHTELKADAGQLRMDSLNRKGKTNTIIFKAHSLYLVNNENKTYSVMDEASMKRMGDRMASMKAKMDAQMANIPPAQRAMIEKMMGGKNAAPAAPEFKHTSRTETVVGIRCDIWEGTTEGKKSEEVCVAPTNAVAGMADAFASLRSFGESMLKMTGSLGFLKKSAAQNPWANISKLNGIPLAQRHFEGDKIVEDMKVTKLTTASVPTSAFEMPAGYQRKDMIPPGA